LLRIKIKKDLFNSYYLPPPPIFCGKKYDFWAIKMRPKLCAEELLDIVLKGFEEPSNQEAYEIMIQYHKHQLI
jgi:hypothetical protein